MGLDEIRGVAVGTLIAFFLLTGLFYLKRAIRNRLFPQEEGRKREEVLAELLLLQTRLQEEAVEEKHSEDREE